MNSAAKENLQKTATNRTINLKFNTTKYSSKETGKQPKHSIQSIHPFHPKYQKRKKLTKGKEKRKKTSKYTYKRKFLKSKKIFQYL